MSLTAPRTLVRINNTVVIAPEHWLITTNGHGVLDTADVTLPVKGTPDLAALVKPGQPLPIEIAAGFPANPEPGGYSFPQLTLRFAGMTDPISPNFKSDDQSVTLRCISFGSVLTADKTTTNLGASGQTYANLVGYKTTDYVRAIAKQFGMKADVNVQGSWTLQDVYATQQIVGVRNMRIWDILVACAQTDGAYLWFSSDKTLHYVDPALITRTIVPLQYGSLQNGIKGFAGSHAVQFSKNIKVEVRSYQSKEKTAHRTRVSQSYDADGNVSSVEVSSTSRTFTLQNFGNPGSAVTGTQTSYGADGTVRVSTVSGSSISSGGETSSGYTSMPTDSTVEKYIYKFHNMTQSQCDKRTLWKWLSSHEYRGTFDLPVTPELLPNAKIETKFRVTDLPWSSFDQDYVPLRLTEAFDLSNSGDGGWSIEVLGINHRLAQSAV